MFCVKEKPYGRCGSKMTYELHRWHGLFSEFLSVSTSDWQYQWFWTTDLENNCLRRGVSYLELDTFRIFDKFSMEILCRPFFALFLLSCRSDSSPYAFSPRQGQLSVSRYIEDIDLLNTLVSGSFKVIKKINTWETKAETFFSFHAFFVSCFYFG